ncbi:hypothetical protein SAMN05660710_03660 [Paracoccus tibetensis]|uniref:Glycosyltransferase family 25 (LPS biosynthesis protein) n=2 Tax=Paracoccus tibetensis TaxID=336292 RepID=A0A1G5K395_9RHOB|nr:hypothetical protein SAMN05660710_03660 [Paracoccus tibetensis]
MKRNLMASLSKMVPRGLYRVPARLLAVLRHEGMTGLYDRVRYPKPFWQRQRHPARVVGPVTIRGGDDADRDQIARALQDAELPLAVSSSDPKFEGTVIHIDPVSQDRTRITQNDILILLRPTSLPEGELLSLTTRCQAVLISCPDILSCLQRGGVPIEKIFALKGRDALHEGITRYLIATKTIPADRQDWRVFSDLDDIPLRRLCLSLPETPARREHFLAGKPKDFEFFDGIRAFPGWVGAATSFRLMAQACLDQNIHPVLFCEDDVELPEDFELRYQVVRDYLATCQWDLFSGLITDVGSDYRVTKVVTYHGQTFVHLNRCVGMVFGLYNRAALEGISSWTLNSGMTIDRHLEATQSLEIVTTLPFLAGHCDDLDSSVWRFKNRRYRNMIHESEARLAQLVKEHDLRNVA